MCSMGRRLVNHQAMIIFERLGVFVMLTKALVDETKLMNGLLDVSSLVILMVRNDGNFMILNVKNTLFHVTLF